MAALQRNRRALSMRLVHFTSTHDPHDRRWQRSGRICSLFLQTETNRQTDPVKLVAGYSSPLIG